MQVALVMLSRDGQRRALPLNRQMTVIGRHDDCDLRVPVNEVSRKHCRLVKDGEGLRIEDLGSSNGTYLNGQRVQEATLEAGDHIRIGPLQFVVQIDGVPADDEITVNEPASAEAQTADTGAFDPMSALLDDDNAQSGVEMDLGDSGDDLTREDT